jgi:hypothetical protein
MLPDNWIELSGNMPVRALTTTKHLYSKPPASRARGLTRIRLIEKHPWF